MQPRPTILANSNRVWSLKLVKSLLLLCVLVYKHQSLFPAFEDLNMNNVWWPPLLYFSTRLHNKYKYENFVSRTGSDSTVNKDLWLAEQITMLLFYIDVTITALPVHFLPVLVVPFSTHISTPITFWRKTSFNDVLSSQNFKIWRGQTNPYFHHHFLVGFSVRKILRVFVCRTFKNTKKL